MWRIFSHPSFYDEEEKSLFISSWQGDYGNDSQMEMVYYTFILSISLSETSAAKSLMMLLIITGYNVSMLCRITTLILDFLYKVLFKFDRCVIYGFIWSISCLFTAYFLLKSLFLIINCVIRLAITKHALLGKYLNRVFRSRDFILFLRAQKTDTNHLGRPD